MTLDVAAYRSALVDERTRIAHAIEYLQAQTAGGDDEMHADTAGSDNHFADSATETIDREIDDTLGENSEQVLAEIDSALDRIEAGTYGTCEICGKPIGEERLEARPWARLCIDDARKQSR